MYIEVNLLYQSVGLSSPTQKPYLSDLITVVVYSNNEQEFIPTIESMPNR